MEELIQTILEYLPHIPGVTSVDIERKPMNDEDVWDVKVWLHFAGSDEPVVMELY